MNKEQKATKNKNTEEKIGGGKRLLGKVLCALLALVLWVYVSYDKRPETSKVIANIPVLFPELKCLKEGILRF